MIEVLENNQKFNRRICPSDWRFSASIVGMIRFFEEEEIEFDISEDGFYLYYNYEDVSEENDEKYFDYVEKTYHDSLHHTVLEDLLRINDKSEEQIKIIKEKMNGNSIMKKVLKGIDFEDDKNILEKISGNREEIIRDTFKNAKFGYAKFANSNKIRSEEGKVCRLNGYYVDTSRKTKSIGFAFDDKTRNYNDFIEFDYIPFAFTQDRESVFINNNISVILLKNSNDALVNKNQDKGKLSYKLNKNFRNEIFYNFSEASSFIDYDVEVILKSQDNDFFETIFVRKEAIEIFESISKIDSEKQYIQKALKYKIKINDDYYIDILNYVTNSVLNLQVLDKLIVFLFRYKFNIKSNDNKRAEKSDYGFLISQLIRVNKLIYRKLYDGGDNNMTYKNVYESAEEVKRKLKEKNMENKLGSYRSKLIGALTANDKDRFIIVLLNLSSYAQVQFDFLTLLTKDFDLYKNVAFDFVSKLNYFEDNSTSTSENTNQNEGE
ncbi:type I CRISPR-associated protein Cas8a1/Csx8 [Finegoldia magna]|uniref:type I CRISPR-associated protein Cas8a1/Csx8 n=1 Tax=Finegoldia magna TaxID=1260 RepID=UPI0013141DDE|nr:type I CRISPR-associated protein Cas8a1/Csx8 [Finegoldia magna]